MKKTIILPMTIVIVVGLVGCKMVERHYHEIRYDVAGGGITVMYAVSPLEVKEARVFFVGRRSIDVNAPADNMKFTVLDKDNFQVVPLKSDEKQPYVVVMEDECVYLDETIGGGLKPRTVKILTINAHANKEHVSYVENSEQWQRVTEGGKP